MHSKQVSIGIVNFRTPELTRVCLRSLRKFSDLSRVEIIVVDNNSQDDSLEYLRSLDWITLIERAPIAGETPADSHARALDMALAKASAPYFMAMHTDSIVISPRWLDYFIAYIEKNEKIGGVGSWKLEVQSPLKRFGKSIEEFFQEHILKPLTGRRRGRASGENTDHYYLRSHGALYRTALLRDYTPGFCGGDTAGKMAHLALVEHGFEMVFLPASELMRYMRHLNHATMILNPQIAGRGTGSAKSRRRLRREMQRIKFDEILNDSSLDFSA